MFMTLEIRRRLRVVAGALAITATAVSAAPAGRQAAPPAAEPAPTQAPAPAPAPTLPGGASQVQESHGDWGVTCAQPAGVKVCSFSQQLVDQNTRQLIIGIELRATSPERAEGALVLPFGLAFEQPITLQVDDRAAPTPLRLRTCLPVGCIVALDLPEASLGSLRTGTAVHVRATTDDGQPIAFALSLNGFGSALDRTVALAK